MMSCVAVLMMRTMRLSVPMRDTPAMQSRNVLYCWKWIFTRRPILKGEKNSNAYRGLVREDGYGDCFNLEHQVTRDCIENVNFYKNLVQLSTAAAKVNYLSSDRNTLPNTVSSTASDYAPAENPAYTSAPPATRTKPVALPASTFFYYSRDFALEYGTVN